jgi:uncharacterized membrane protein
VIKIGLGSKSWFAPILGAIAALVLTVTIVFILHGYLMKVPDVLIRLGAGVLLVIFGTFWLGQGLGFKWPFEDASILILFMLYASLSFVAVRWIQWRANKRPADQVV